MADGFEVATAYVKISPDTDGFAEELESKVEEATAGVEGKVKISGDDEELDAILDDAKAKLDELDGKEGKVTLSADDGDLSAKVDDAKAKLDDLDGKHAEPVVGLDKGEFDEAADDTTARLRMLAGTRAEAVIGADAAPAQASLAELQRQLAVLKAQKAGVEVDANATPAEVRIAQVQAQIAALNAEKAVAALGLNASDFDGSADAATAKLTQLNSEHAKPTAELNADPAKAAIDDLKMQLAILRAQKAGITLDADATPAEAQIAMLQAQIKQLQEEGKSTSIGGEGSMLGSVTMGVGALMPGIGGATAGLGLLGATGALAFGGITKALSAAHQASQNVGITPQQTAATNFSNSVQVVQAQQSVTQAREQAAQDAETSNNSIEQADMNLASVARNTAASQVQALQSVQQAQQGVQQATYSLSEANYNLSQAYVQAREQIVQLNDQLADSKLSVESASLAVQQAEYQEKLVNQDAYSTSIQRQQAALAVAQAKQQVTDATDQESNAQVAATLANKQGVNGSQTVIQAKQAQKAAQYSVTNANNSYADSVRNLTNTELNNASQVKQAQMQVAQAQEQAAYQQKMDAQSVAVAERNVTDTIREQQLQWAATQSTANQAANQFAKYMANLTPAGRSFVNEVLGMKTAFKGLETAAQNAVLPGFTVFLKGIASLAPEIKTGVSEMGGAIGKAFAGFGKELQTPAAAKVLNGLMQNGMQFMNVVLPAFGTFFGELAKIGSMPGASSGLAGLLGGIARGLTGLAASVGKYEPQINGFLKAVGNIIAQIGPPLGTIIGLTAKALGPLTSYLNKHPNGTVAKVIGGIVAGIIAFKTLSGPIGMLTSLPDKISKTWEKVTGIPGKITDTWGKITGFPGKVASTWGKVFGDGGSVPTMVGGLKNMVTGLPGTMSGVVDAIKGWGIWSAVASGATKIWTGIQAGFNLIMDANPIALVVIAIVGLGLAAVEAYKHFAWFRDVVKGAFDDIEKGALFLWHGVFEPVWDGIKHIAEDAWNFIYNGFGKYLLPMLGPVGWIALGVIELSQHWKQIWGDIKTAGEAVWHGIETGVSVFVGAFKTTWNTLEGIFKTPVNFLIKTVYDGGIAKLWNDVVGAVGLGSLKLPIISGLAGGGVLPGYSPGHDTVPALLSPGEAVLTPGATRAVGGAPVINALNAAYAPSRGGSGSGHFAQGGTVSGEDEQGSGSSGSAGGEAGKLAGKETEKRTVERPAEHVATLGMLANGGIVQRFSLGGIVSGLLSGGTDTAKAIAALATGNTVAFTNALSGLIGTSAAGSLGQVMVALPKTLVTDAAKAAMGMMGGGSGGSSGGLGALPQNYHTIASYLAAHGFTKAAAAGITGNIQAESGGNPEAIEVGGGGGGGLIQWTPWQSYGNLITGNASADLMTQLGAILSFGGGPAAVNKGTSPSNAAMIYQDEYERPASMTASLGQRMSSANSVAKAMGWSFDSGGALPRGMTLAVNQTSGTEEVLTPDERAAWVAMVKQMTAGGGSAGGTGKPPVNFNFYGTQLPTAEQQAEMDRHYSLLVG